MLSPLSAHIALLATSISLKEKKGLYIDPKGEKKRIIRRKTQLLNTDLLLPVRQDQTWSSS